MDAVLARGTLGKYRIIDKLGQGGMADVYRAEDPDLGRQLALKVLPPEFTRDPDRVRRFEKEVRAAAALDHRNIVTIYEFGTDAGFHFYTMNLLSGGDLKQRIAAGIAVPEALAVLKAVAAALDYAHRKSFVHQDIKPENILFDGDGYPLLTDFGIARSLDGGTRMTGTGLSIGTPHYMSPEQAQGKAEIDGRADLYSLGIVFYEMLTGAVPYEADNTVGVAMQHVQSPIPELPESLTAYQPILDRLLAKDPADRYGSGAQLIGGLDRLAQGEALVRPAQGTRVMPVAIEGQPSPARSNGLAWRLGGVVLAVLVMGGAWIYQEVQLKPLPAGGGGALSQVAPSLPAPGLPSRPTPINPPAAAPREPALEVALTDAERPPNEPVAEERAEAERRAREAALRKEQERLKQLRRKQEQARKHLAQLEQERKRQEQAEAQRKAEVERKRWKEKEARKKIKAEKKRKAYEARKNTEAEKKRKAEAKRLAAEGRAKVAAANEIVFEFLGHCWVDIRDSTRKFKIFGEMNKGTRKILGGEPPYSVILGNSAMVRITVDGRPFDLESLREHAAEGAALFRPTGAHF